MNREAFQTPVEARRGTLPLWSTEESWTQFSSITSLDSSPLFWSITSQHSETTISLPYEEAIARKKGCKYNEAKVKRMVMKKNKVDGDEELCLDALIYRED